MRLNNDFIPPGNYNDFISCGTGTLEYSGGTYIITDNYLDMNNLVISGTGVKTLPNNNINLCGNLSILETSTLKMYPDAARNLNIKGNMTKEAGASFLKSLGCRVIFSGVSGQFLTGDLTGTNSFCQLQVNNPTGLTISGQAEATTELHLTSGIVTTTNPLILSGANGLLEYSSSSYISGPFSRLLPSTAGTYYYPVGKSNRYKLSALIDPSIADDYWTMEYFRANPGNTTSLGSGVSTVSLVEYWEVTGSSGQSAKIQFSLTGTSDVAAAVADINNLIIVRWSGSAWEIVGGGADVVGPITAGTITTTNPVTFSGATEKFALATIVPVTISSVGFETADMTVCIDDNASVELEILLTGTSPWQVTYTVNGVEQTPQTFSGAGPYLLTISAPTVTTEYVLTEVRDNDGAGDPGNLFNETVTVTIIQKPTAETVTSGGNICSGQSTSVTVANSDSNFSYELVLDGITRTGTILAGNDGDLIFSNITVAGEYWVYGFTSGYPDCYQEMTNPVTIDALDAPTATVSIDPSGSACAGGNLSISLSLTGTDPYSFNLVSVQGGIEEVLQTVTSQVGSVGGFIFNVTCPEWIDNSVRPIEPTEYTFTLRNFVDSSGCAGVVTPATVDVWKRPETGPQYHISNTFGE